VKIWAAFCAGALGFGGCVALKSPNALPEDAGAPESGSPSDHASAEGGTARDDDALASGDAPGATDGFADDTAAKDVSTEAVASPTPSCVGVIESCGHARDQNCCRRQRVPGGPFNRLNDPQLPATVSPLELDVFEVTAARFRTFVLAGKGTRAAAPAASAGAPPHVANGGWNANWDGLLPASTAELIEGLEQGNGTYVDVLTRPNRPLNNVSWYLAFAFCVWDGGRLPTEAEWNFAAAGGSDQRLYPWAGSDVNGTYASYACLGDTTDAGARCEARFDILEVGMRNAGNGTWGQADLGGNLWEWVLDADGTPTPTCADCANLDGSQRIIRGGAYDSPSESLIQTTSRAPSFPSIGSPDTGFRCARDLSAP
jgi:formylglycine-generating enzyme required for sulfatase activity